MAVERIGTEIYQGLRPSRQLDTLVTEAVILGVNPIPEVVRATIAAHETGRRKVGFFGEPAKSLRPLRDKVLNAKLGY